MLSSGKESDFYIDCKQTSLSAEGHVLIGKVIFSLIQENFPEARCVGGPTLGADPLVSAVSLISWIEQKPLDGFIVRKEPKGHGTGVWLEGATHIPAGTRVVMLEDAITTGATTVRSIQRVVEAGLHVLGVVVLVDRLEGAREKIEQTGCKICSVFDRHDFL